MKYDIGSSTISINESIIHLLICEQIGAKSSYHVIISNQFLQALRSLMNEHLSQFNSTRGMSVIVGQTVKNSSILNSSLPQSFLVLPIHVAIDIITHLIPFHIISAAIAPCLLPMLGVFNILISTKSLSI